MALMNKPVEHQSAGGYPGTQSKIYFILRIVTIEVNLGKITFNNIDALIWPFHVSPLMCQHTYLLDHLI